MPRTLRPWLLAALLINAAVVGLLAARALAPSDPPPCVCSPVEAARARIERLTLEAARVRAQLEERQAD